MVSTWMGDRLGTPRAVVFLTKNFPSVGNFLSVEKIFFLGQFYGLLVNVLGREVELLFKVQLFSLFLCVRKKKIYF